MHQVNSSLKAKKVLHESLLDFGIKDCHCKAKYRNAFKNMLETSHLFCTANQMAGFYMKYNTVLKGVKLDM